MVPSIGVEARRSWSLTDVDVFCFGGSVKQPTIEVGDCPSAYIYLRRRRKIDRRRLLPDDEVGRGDCGLLVVLRPGSIKFS